MLIIPVIDIKDNQVVHAIEGDRADYRPLNSYLCPSSDPFDVVSYFLYLTHFKYIYIADLNAIMRNGDNDKLLVSLMHEYPDINFWIDNGFRQQFCSSALPNFIPVIGSESLHKTRLDSLKRLDNPWILSLDHGATNIRLGPDPLFEDERYWPEYIILMTLTKVGGQNGPDFDKLQYYRKNYPTKQFIAAGGIRNLQDLFALQDNGIHHALVASALHNGAIGKQEISLLTQLCHRKVINY